MPNPDGTPTAAEAAEEKVRKASNAVDDASWTERGADVVTLGADVALAASVTGTPLTAGAAAPSLAVTLPAAAAANAADLAARSKTDHAVEDAERAEAELNAIRAAQGLPPVDVDYAAQARPIETAVYGGAEAAYDYAAEGASEAYDYVASGEAYNDVAETAEAGYQYTAETAEAAYDYTAESAEAAYNYTAESAEAAYDYVAEGASGAVDAVAETWESVDLNPFDDE
jgi:hypothetical protein